jgi:acyl-coenzyme A synthetase/AMP-(fatty) acid ligase
VDREAAGTGMSTAPFGPAHHPLARTFCGPRDHVFLRDDRQAWTVDRLLSLAGDVAEAVPPGAGARVAVRARSAAFVVASLVGLWQGRRHPLLLDPVVGEEAAGNGHLDDGMPTLVPAWEGAAPPEIAVAETGRATAQPSLPSLDDTILAFFTSGSTGAPKIVPKRDFQLRQQFAIEPAWLGLHGPIRSISLVPAHHILGYIYGFNLPAATGGSVVFPPGSSPRAWIDAVRRERPSLVVGVPLHYRLISQALTEPLPEALYLSSGGMLPASVGEAFRDRAGWPIVQVYGSTEAGGIATRIGVGPWQPLPGLDWHPRAADGRLVIRSPWQDPPHSWHHLDDVVERADAGFALVGRADSVVKVGGRRFSLAEVVQAAQSSPLVDQAQAVTYTRYGELAVALFVVAQRSSGLTQADVRAFLAGRLAPFKVPRTIRVLDELPSHGIGKIDDAALRRLADSDADPGSGS